MEYFLVPTRSMRRDLIYTDGKTKWTMIHSEGASVTGYSTFHYYRDLTLRFHHYLHRQSLHNTRLYLHMCHYRRNTSIRNPLDNRWRLEWQNRQELDRMSVYHGDSLHQAICRDKRKNSMNTNCCVFESMLPIESHFSFGYSFRWN